MSNLRKAERRQAKLRIGLSAPSGAGKTYSALLLASGMADWDKIAIIDTEAGSGELYAHLGGYNVRPLEKFSPEEYVKAILECEEAGMEVIIIDSITPEWEACLEINETLAQAKYRSNTWSAWNETTPRHQRFIDKILTSKAHIITTVRNKTETMMTENKQVKKVGTKEVTREGYEYNLTLNFNLDRDTHLATVSKDRTNLFEKQDPFIITPDTGKQLVKWAISGKKAEAPTPTPTVTKKAVVDYLRSKCEGIKTEDIKEKIIEITTLDPSITEPAVVMEALIKAYEVPNTTAKKSIASKIKEASKKE
jgi:hypothetical protein